LRNMPKGISQRAYPFGRVFILTFFEFA
jgi:hypothetical protein